MKLTKIVLVIGIILFIIGMYGVILIITMLGYMMVLSALVGIAFWCFIKWLDGDGVKGR